jgi:hypothetical protein
VTRVTIVIAPSQEAVQELAELFEWGALPG